MTQRMDLRDCVCSVSYLSVLSGQVISADVRFAVVETIFFTRTGTANAFDLVTVLQTRKSAMSPHAEHREAQAKGLRACKKSISCVVKKSKDRLSRAHAHAPRRCKPPTLLHETVPGPRHSDVDLDRVKGGAMMRCQAIHAREAL